MPLPQIDNNKYFALCRLPQEKEVLYVSSMDVEAYTSINDISSATEGFIIAPFITSPKTPIYILKNAIIEHFSINTDEDNGSKVDSMDIKSDRNSYTRAFNIVKDSLSNGECKKVVLARPAKLKTDGIDICHLFEKACRKYPYCYICAFNIPGKGTWLTATPELLYSQQGNNAYTMALAGTMLWSAHENGAEWPDKDVREQQIVVDFITDNLKQLGIQHNVSERFTAKAGHLAHICNKILISADSNIAPVRMLQILHPTPAIAGIPRNNALKVIAQSEGEDSRGYYAGFTGFINSPSLGTSCYVSLRLMHLNTDNCITLYAGGGILPESDEDREWHETEIKLQTISSLL